MKKRFNYYSIKWIAFFLTVVILGFSTAGIYLQRLHLNKTARPTPPESKDPTRYSQKLSNQEIGTLVENKLNPLKFMDDIQFKGSADGFFTITAKLSKPENILAINGAFNGFEDLLSSLKGERFVLKGHIGETEEGAGKFVADTFSFSGYTIPAGPITSFIESYTNLNELVNVPYNQIMISESGISYEKDLPETIQIVSRS